MDKIRQWTLTVSAVSIVSGVLISLLPENMNKSYFKVIASIILIYAALQPFIGSNSIGFEIDDFLKDNYQVSENLDRYAVNSMLSSAEKAIEDLFLEKAEKSGLKLNFNCECVLNGNEISVEKIRAYPITNTNEMHLVEEWSDEFGFDKSIVIFEGVNNESR